MKQEAIAKFVGINDGRGNIEMTTVQWNKEDFERGRTIRLSRFEHPIIWVEFPKKAHSFFIKNNTDYQLTIWLCDDTNDERVYDEEWVSGQNILPRTAEEIYISEDNNSECYKKVVGFAIFTGDSPLSEVQFKEGDFITIQGEDIYVEDNEKVYITIESE